MKKIALIPLCLLGFVSLAQDYEMYFPESSVVEYVKDDNNILDERKMKKKTSSDVDNKAQRKLELDNTQLNHQRALDYTTRQNNSMLPLF